MSQIVLYFLHITSVLLFYTDVVLTLSISELILVAYLLYIYILSPKQR